MASYYGARSRLAKMVIEKMENDDYILNMNRSEWYHFELNNLPSYIYEKFIKLNEDVETQKFIENSKEKSNWLFTQLYHSFALTFLRLFMSTTSINGLLQRGSMFVFSMSQFQTLMNIQNNTKFDSLLDIGAGDGLTTEKMAPFFNSVYATEMSPTMQWRLGQKGFKVLDVFNWHRTIENNEMYLKFDVISCLNLFDRCDKPITLIKEIKSALKQGGYLICALVLPFKPYVEYNKNNKPTELFPFVSNNSSASGFDENRIVSEQIIILIEQVFRPLGFELEKFSRLPYLCEGNLSQSFYYLIDYLFIFKSV